MPINQHAPRLVAGERVRDLDVAHLDVVRHVGKSPLEERLLFACESDRNTLMLEALDGEALVRCELFPRGPRSREHVCST